MQLRQTLGSTLPSVPNGTFTYGYDLCGSVSQLVDTDGNSRASYDYLPYGQSERTLSQGGKGDGGGIRGRIAGFLSALGLGGGGGGARAAAANVAEKAGEQEMKNPVAPADEAGAVRATDGQLREAQRLVEEGGLARLQKALSSHQRTLEEHLAKLEQYREQNTLLLRPEGREAGYEVLGVDVCLSQGGSARPPCDKGDRACGMASVWRVVAPLRRPD